MQIYIFVVRMSSFGGPQALPGGAKPYVYGGEEFACKSLLIVILVKYV
jgi:hypothetical protein